MHIALNQIYDFLNFYQNVIQKINEIHASNEHMTTISQKAHLESSIEFLFWRHIFKKGNLLPIQRCGFKLWDLLFFLEENIKIEEQKDKVIKKILEEKLKNLPDNYWKITPELLDKINYNNLLTNAFYGITETKTFGGEFLFEKQILDSVFVKCESDYENIWGKMISFALSNGSIPKPFFPFIPESSQLFESNNPLYVDYWKRVYKTYREKEIGVHKQWQILQEQLKTVRKLKTDQNISSLYRKILNELKNEEKVANFIKILSHNDEIFKQLNNMVK